MILASKLKALFDSIPDTQPWVDVWLVDANGGGVSAADVQLSTELGTNASVLVTLPDGYTLKT